MIFIKVILPDTNVALYAVSAMAAIGSCVIGGPVANMMIVFELTTDYQATLAAGISIVFASIISFKLIGQSVFDRVLFNRNIINKIGSFDKKYNITCDFDFFIRSSNYYDFEYTGSVTIALNLEGVIPQINDEVRAFYNGELRGVAKGMVIPVNDEVVFPLMLYSNNSHEEITFKYYNSLSEETDLVEKIIFVPDMHLNNAIDPYFMTDEIPLTYSLYNAYPNPFNPTTTINYSIADNVNKLQINVYDLQGRLVEKLYNGSQNKGEHKVIWNASSFASGLYFIQMIAGKHQFTNKVMLVK